MKKLITGFMALSTILSGCNSNNPEPDFKLKAVDQPLSNPVIEQKVNALYDKMNPQERLAQLHSMYLADLFSEDGKLDTQKCEELIPNGVGHFSQYANQDVKDPDEIRDMVAQVQEWIMTNTPSGVPALFHDEIISGVATRGATAYPQQIGLACSFNPQLAEVKTQQTAMDMRMIGGLLSLSPMVDVDRNPHFNRDEESYGEDGYLSAAMGVGFVRGLQDGGLSKGIAACTKDFLGYGGGGDAQYKELMEEILMPHEAMIRIAGSKVLMPGYHTFHGTKCVGSEELLGDILRDYLKFDGVVVSDYGAVTQQEHVTGLVEQGASALNAGNDVEFPRNDAYQFLPKAIEQGLVTEQTFETAVKRVLTLKAALGMLDENPNLYKKGHIELDRPDERQTAYTMATQSVVLLQNNGILPLNVETLNLKPETGNTSKKIFLTGPNANNMWAMLGDYSYQGMSYFWKGNDPDDEHPHIVKLKEGLEKRMPSGFSVEYTRGCDWTEENETVIEAAGDERAQAWLVALLDRKIDGKEEIDRAKAIKMAAESDVIVAAMGENTMLCGENRDRKTLRLPGSQEQFVEELIATGKPVVLIMFGGRAQIISNIADKCAAIIQAWYPGEEGGNAVADILYGNVAPSGKLSVSYPNVELNENICYNYSEEKDPRVEWPFGFGLSYTSFEYSNLSVTKSAKTSDKCIHIAFDVENTGSMTADEIAQIYLSPSSLRSQHIKPIQLQGFGRVTLAAGEKKHLEFIMSPQQFGYFANRQWNIDPGMYIIKVGASSQDIRLSAEVELTGDQTTMPLRDVYFAEMQ